MKTNSLHHLLTLACVLAVGPSALAAAESAPSSAISPEDAAAQWSDIQACTHERRTEFFVGLKRLEAKLAGQIRELVAKRATMKGITSTREWDIAMKELESARTYLQAVGAELTKASRETWDQEKDKVGRAWVDTQDAYAEVKRSTTS